MFSKAAPPLSSNNVELGWKGENRCGCEVTLQKVHGNGPALPHWKWEFLMHTFYGHSWTRFKGKKSCRYCRTSTLLVFYRFEQSLLHSLKREIPQCFKAFLLLYHFYYHFKANFLVWALVVLWSWSIPTARSHQITPGVICPLQEEAVLCLRDKLFSAALHLATAWFQRARLTPEFMYSLRIKAISCPLSYH